MKLVSIMICVLLLIRCDEVSPPTAEEMILAPRHTQVGPADKTRTYDFVCDNDTDLDIYMLNEHYFSSEDKIEFNVHVIYYSNGENNITKKFFTRRLGIVNEFYNETNSNISFRFSKFTKIDGKPHEDSVALSNIENLEKLAKKKREDIRNYYYISHMDFWQNVYGLEHHINVHVFNDSISTIAGFAGGIGSTYMSVELFYNDPYYSTWEHELGHVLGLYHTHKFDPNSNAFSNETGDRVCDTPKSPPLTGAVTDECELAINWKNQVRKTSRGLTYNTNNPDVLDGLDDENLDKLIKNVMSYTRHSCRSSFTEGQVSRMKKIIETNADLRRCISDLESSYKQQLWQNLRQY